MAKTAETPGVAGHRGETSHVIDPPLSHRRLVAQVVGAPRLIRRPAPSVTSLATRRRAPL